VAEFQKLVPGSRLTIILDAAHGTLGRKPDEYRKVIENFFDSIEEKRE
jgi:pimeloyl-ACP methyl ester carboxylesterase